MMITKAINWFVSKIPTSIQLFLLGKSKQSIQLIPIVHTLALDTGDEETK
jgi:hypothetical protein